MAEPESSGASPKPRRRRKEARPGEIVAAAIEVFAEKGFGAAKLEEVARRAGVAKGTVFVYFPTKPDLFRAVAKTVLSVNFEPLAGEAETPLSELLPRLLALAAALGQSPVGAVIRLIVAEAQTFPDLAQVWHDEVIAKVMARLTTALEHAQARGEVRPGDARLYVFSIVGPMLAAIIFRQVFAEAEAELPDLDALARQHAQIILRGLAAS